MTESSGASDEPNSSRISIFHMHPLHILVRFLSLQSCSLAVIIGVGT